MKHPFKKAYSLRGGRQARENEETRGAEGGKEKRWRRRERRREVEKDREKRWRKRERREVEKEREK